MLPLTNPISIVLTVLAVTLLAPLLLNRLRIPYIIGLIAAGMALGPYGFGVLEYGEPLRVFGEVGLLYLMFLAGVEIDMYHQRHNYRRGIAFGLLTFALPMATGVGVAFCLPGTGLGAALLRRVEEEGRRQGARRVLLNTFSFQAPGFYEKQGYRCFGALEPCFGTHGQYFFCKEL